MKYCIVGANNYSPLQNNRNPQNQTPFLPIHKKMYFCGDIIMHLKKSILSLLLLGLCALAAEAQCPDFMDLTSSAVTGYYGLIGDSVQNVGIVPGRHTLITQQGTDPRTGGQLPLIPDGENAVIRLGNWMVGAETESLVYAFTVDSDYSILLLKYAVVLEDPHHIEIEQPRFLIQMLNANDELLSGCMEYNVISSPIIPGFQAHGHVMWRPWTVNGFDLSEYAGQTVKFQISTFDCRAGAHYGYAYFTASCISNRLSITGCNGQQVTITAPSGFESYTWNNGSHSTSTTYTIQGNTVATCVINTVTGCQITQSVTFTQDTFPQDYVFYDTICEGMDYHNHGFNLPVYSTPGEYIAYNTYYNASDCIEEGVNTLYLHVHSRYHHIYDVACEGESYNANGFQYSQLVQGEITDTNYVPLPYGCDSTTILHLTVNHVFSMSDVIVGPSEVCGGSSEIYSLVNAPSQTIYHWMVPDGVVLYGGQGTPNVHLYFTPNTPASIQIALTADNGCGSSTIPFNIVVGPSYSNMFSDTICTGSSYTQHGYQLGIQDTAGYFVHILNDTTQQGCDSVSVLELFVAETPSVEALADPAIMCVGSETNLYAVGSQASVTLTSQLPKVWVGDILCTDGTTVHPENWPCNKVAMGVVFHVDNTGEHGWAVGLQETPGLMWGLSLQNDIPQLGNFTNGSLALNDMDGYANTLLIRQDGDSYEHEAAYAVDFDNGWYLPAIGQIFKLCAENAKLNISLQLVGGAVISLNTGWMYWTSTEVSNNRAWVLGSSNILTTSEKNYPHSVRSVRSF